MMTSLLMRLMRDNEHYYSVIGRRASESLSFPSVRTVAFVLCLNNLKI